MSVIPDRSDPQLADFERRFHEARGTEARNRVAIEIMKATEGIARRSERSKDAPNQDAIHLRALATRHFHL